MTGTLTDPVNAFLIPFLSLSHSDSVYDFTLKTHVYTQVKRQSSRPNCLRTGNDEIMSANYDLDNQ